MRGVSRTVAVEVGEVGGVETTDHPAVATCNASNGPAIGWW